MHEDALSDDDLVGRCLTAKQAATAAFDELYARHAGAVLGFLHGMHRGDEHAARDALQETFFRFYTALPSFERGRPLRPWLFRIARNASLDAWKKERRQPTPTEQPELAGSGDPGPEQEASRRETAVLLRGAVHELPPHERAVFLLKHDQGLTYAQVAESLSCSVRTAKYRMKSALERLGRAVEQMGVTLWAC
jgi:RNA polymerase sigma-70 factor (ECF subfamily)